MLKKFALFGAALAGINSCADVDSSGRESKVTIDCPPGVTATISQSIERPGRESPKERLSITNYDFSNFELYTTRGGKATAFMLFKKGTAGVEALRNTDDAKALFEKSGSFWIYTEDSLNPMQLVKTGNYERNNCRIQIENDRTENGVLTKSSTTIIDPKTNELKKVQSIGSNGEVIDLEVSK